MRETPQALQAFECYWALGDGRTLERVSQELAKSLPLLKRWSSEHHWQERVKARIEEQAASRDKARQAAIIEAEARLLQEGIDLQVLAAEAIRQKAAQGRLGAVAAVQALALGAKLELRGLRQPEAITRQEMTGADGEPIALDLEPRERLARQLDSLAARLAAAGAAGEPDAG